MNKRVICDDDAEVGSTQDFDRDRAGTPHVTSAVGDSVGIDQFEVWKSLHPHFQGDLHFQSGEIRTEAAVRPKTERRMTVFFSVDEDFIRTCLLYTSDAADE